MWELHTPAERTRATQAGEGLWCQPGPCLTHVPTHPTPSPSVTQTQDLLLSVWAALSPSFSPQAPTPPCPTSTPLLPASPALPLPPRFRMGADPISHPPRAQPLPGPAMSIPHPADTQAMTTLATPRTLAQATGLIWPQLPPAPPPPAWIRALGVSLTPATLLGDSRVPRV